MKKIIAQRYELIELIGQGGMADVYIAQDLILNRRVAIKMLRTNLAKDPVYVTRFQREASASAALSHKNIVEIYDVGEDEGKYFIVMECVIGLTLKELNNRRGALHVAEAIDIMVQVTSGATKAHQMGIIHRDLKPQNILVTESGVAKIADFGIASMQSLTQVTKTDVIMGSLHYLAPELARGEKATVQSDIYALGIVLYELLRGEVPFHGETPVNIALKHMQSSIPSILEFNPTIPQSVDNIIIKATAKNLNNRYQSVDEMYHDLVTCLDRLNEKPLVFEYDTNIDPTIIVDSKEVFGQTEKEEKENNIEKKESKKPNKKIIIGGLASLALVALIAFTFLLGGSKPITMPDLSGLTLDDGIALLEQKELEVDKKIIEASSDKYEAGEIISTNPSKNTSVEKGDVIQITVSTGKEVLLPNFVGKNIDEATKELKALGFKVEVENIASDEHKRDTIISQSIEEGEIVSTDENRTIKLVVSKGKEIILDDYTSLLVEKAKQELEALGFVVTIVEKHTDEQPAGIVLSQSVKEGTIFSEEDELKIELVVAISAELEVPNVQGINYLDARSELESKGFVVVLNDLGMAKNESDIVGAIIKQTPNAFSVVDASKNQVEISYYSKPYQKPEEPEVPSVPETEVE